MPNLLRIFFTTFYVSLNVDFFLRILNINNLRAFILAFSAYRSVLPATVYFVFKNALILKSFIITYT
jgi:hypothetical protein